MSNYESDFDFELELEDDDCEDFGTRDIDDAQRSSNEEMMQIENAFYEAEDLISKKPKQALECFEGLLRRLNNKIDEETMSHNWSNWRSKIFRNMLNLPSDLQMKLNILEQCITDLKTSTNTEATSSLICSCLDSIATAAPLETAIEMHGKARREFLKADLKRASRQVFLKEAKLLSESTDANRLENLLQEAYWEWVRLHMPDHGSHLTTALLRTFETVSHSDLADVLEFLAIDVQDKASNRSAERIDRLERILPQCRRLSRVLLDKKTAISLYSAYAKSLCVLGRYGDAYVAFYGAWDAAYSLGSLLEAQSFLLNLTACNILSKSQIDPLSSREAQALLSSPDQPDFKRLAEWLCRVARAAHAKNCVELTSLVSQIDFLRTGVFEGGDAEEELIYSVRCERWSALDNSSSEVALRELAFEDERALLLFLSHGNLSRRDAMTLETRSGMEGVAIGEHLLEHVRMKSTSLLGSKLRTEQASN